MKTKPTIFAILVSERGSGREVELCRVGSNPAAIVEACKLKMLNVLPKGSEKRIQTPKYDSVRYIAVSIAVAIILSLSPETTHATNAQAPVKQCMTLQQARGAFSSQHLYYRRGPAGARCWSPVRYPSQRSRGRVAVSRPADRSQPVTARKDDAPAIQTFESRWNLR